LNVRILGKQRRSRATQIEKGNRSDQTDIPTPQPHLTYKGSAEDLRISDTVNGALCKQEPEGERSTPALDSFPAPIWLF
jgi:hypothetical protein